MFNFLKIFGFGKKIKQVIKPGQTAVFAKYNTIPPALISKKENTLSLVYDYKAYIPKQYTTPEFRSYLSLTTYKRKNVREIKAEQIRLEHEKQEQLKKELFKKHEDAVSAIIQMDSRLHKQSDYDKYITHLTNPDMCLNLLDYDKQFTHLADTDIFLNVTEYYEQKISNKKLYLDRGNTNNILLRKIAQSGKSPERAESLIERFEAVERQYRFPGCFPDFHEKQKRQKWYHYPKEVTELTNAIMHTSNEKQLSYFSKVLEKCALYTDYDICTNALSGITKAAQDIPIPKDFIKPMEMFIKQDSSYPEDAALVLSYIDGTFDIIADLMKRHSEGILRTDRTVSAGFRSAIKDGKLEEYKQIVFNIKNGFLSYLINDSFKNRTPAEDKLFKKEITVKLLEDEYYKHLAGWDKTAVEKIFNVKKDY